MSAVFPGPDSSCWRCWVVTQCSCVCGLDVEWLSLQVAGVWSCRRVGHAGRRQSAEPPPTVSVAPRVDSAMTSAVQFDGQWFVRQDGGPARAGRRRRRQRAGGTGTGPTSRTVDRCLLYGDLRPRRQRQQQRNARMEAPPFDELSPVIAAKHLQSDHITPSSKT